MSNFYSVKYYIVRNTGGTDILYFNQFQGFVHSKRWSKYAILMFLCQKAEKRKKKQEICCKI